jgi:site-specific recombinase XerD
MSTIDEFADFYHGYHNISARRRRQQVKTLGDLADSAGVAPEEVTRDHLTAFLVEQVEAGLAPTTITKNLGMIQPFYRWLWERGVIDGDHLMQLRAVRPPRGGGRRQPRPYRGKEVEWFWRELADSYPWSRTRRRPSKPASREHGEWLFERYLEGKTPWGRAYQYPRRVQIEAIAALALFGGLRRSEIYWLDPEEMHPDEGFITVRGAAKNPQAEQKWRGVPWTAQTMRDAVGLWLEVRERLGTEGPEPLVDPDRPWLALHGRYRVSPMRQRTFGLLLRRIGRGWEFHRMRHTCATELLRAGMPIERLAKLLGHANISMTQRYAELVERDVVTAAARVESRVEKVLAAGREENR